MGGLYAMATFNRGVVSEMKRIGLAAILLVVVWFLPSSAQAQCNGVFGANTVCGSAAGGPPSPVALGTIGGVTGPGSSTVGDVAVWNNAAGTLLSDGGPAIIGLTTNLTLYVNPSTTTAANCNGLTCQAGNDSNSCLTISAPCATITHAINLFQINYNLRTYQATVQLSDINVTGASYGQTQVTQNLLGGVCGGGNTANQLTIQGNTTTPTNVVIVGSGGNAAFTFVSVTCPIMLKYFQIGASTSGAAAAGNGITADFGSKVYYSNITWGYVTNSYSHVSAEYESMIEQEGPETIVGGGGVHWYATLGAQILMSNTITCTGTPAFGSAFVAINNGAIFSLNGSTFSGCSGVTGTRYIADSTAIFANLGVDPNSVFPGNANGVISRRTLLTGATAFYVATTGSDTNNNCTASGSPCLTAQHAYNVVAQNYDLGGYAATIQMADGTYTDGQISITNTWIGGGSITVNGNSITPSNVVLNITCGGCYGLINQVPLPGILTIENMKIQTSGSAVDCIRNNGFGVIQFTNIVFGACVGFNIAAVNGGAIVTAVGNYTIAGNAAAHAYVAAGGEIFDRGVTATLTGTPAFAAGYVYVTGLSNYQANAMTFSGSATGARYYVDTNSLIFTNSGGANYFPGNSAGTSTTGGLYQ